MARDIMHTLVIRPSARRNPGALLRTLVSLSIAAVVAALIVLSDQLGDTRPALGLVSAAAGVYGVGTYGRWRYRNRIEVDDSFVKVYTTAERHGVWFHRDDIRSLMADCHAIRVVGPRGPLGTLGVTDWHGRPVRALTDAIGCRSRGVWPPAVLTVPSGVLTAAGRRRDAVESATSWQAGATVSRHGHCSRWRDDGQTASGQVMAARSDGGTIAAPPAACACTHVETGG
jgi:hypothetical protein